MRTRERLTAAVKEGQSQEHQKKKKVFQSHGGDPQVAAAGEGEKEPLEGTNPKDQMGSDGILTELSFRVTDSAPSPPYPPVISSCSE